MKIGEIVEAVTQLGKTPTEKQVFISIAEAFNIWDTLVSRYDDLNLTNILASLTKDSDLKLIINTGIDILNYQAKELENIMKSYAIPMPEKPPEKANISSDVNIITDKTIFRLIHKGIKETTIMLNLAAVNSSSSLIREMFNDFLQKEQDLYDKFIEYGKLKGYLHEIPSFRV